MKLLDRLFGRKAAELTYDQVAGLIDGVGGGKVAGVIVMGDDGKGLPGLANPRGFCAGVERAIEIVERALARDDQLVLPRQLALLQHQLLLQHQHLLLLQLRLK